jgi:hypothetical protein
MFFFRESHFSLHFVLCREFLGRMHTIWNILFAGAIFVALYKVTRKQRIIAWILLRRARRRFLDPKEDAKKIDSTNEDCQAQDGDSDDDEEYPPN